MNLCDILSDGGFHTAVVTTFAVDLDAFEAIAFNRLRGAWCRNVILLADAGMVALALEDAMPSLAVGSRYLLAKVSTGRAGVFHPKVTIQLGRKSGRMVITSANATAAGLAGNLELACIVECGPDDSGEQRLVAAGWRYVTGFLDVRQRAVAERLAWARDRTPWLARSVPADGPVRLADGTEAAFLGAVDGEGLAARFAQLVGRQKINRLAVISPYWDHDIAALASLRRQLSPADTVVLVDTAQALFPVAALEQNPGVRVVELRGFDPKRFPERKHRFIHAKLVNATSEDADHVLVGSANCTVAALGDRGRGGSNDEACLYRRVPAGSVLINLGLADTADGPGLDPEDLPPFDPGEAISLGAEAARNPGDFERVYERVAWWPPSKEMRDAVAHGSAEPELIDKFQAPLASVLEPLSPFAPNDHPRWLRLVQPSPPPAFGRIRLAGGLATGLAVVTSVEELRSEVREQPNRRAEHAAWTLETETEEGLWLLEALTALEEPSEDVSTTEPPQAKEKRQQRVHGDNTGDRSGSILDYASFMAGRTRRISAAEAERNSLAGSGASLVRGFLNRIIGLGRHTIALDASRRDLEARALDVGDEVDDAEAAIEAGLDLGATTPRLEHNGEAGLRHRGADANAIAAAVDAFTHRVRGPVAQVLSTNDLLRLRALLTVIIVAGWNGPGPHASRPSPVQVLPIHDGNRTDTWPRLIGRALAPFFSGPCPAIIRLSLDRVHDRLPDDVLECFACCRWAAGAAFDAVRRTAPRSELAKIMEQLVVKVRAFQDLSPEELAAPAYAGVIEGMNKRFSPRLDIGGATLAASGGDRRAARRLKKLVVSV